MKKNHLRVHDHWKKWDCSLNWGDFRPDFCMIGILYLGQVHGDPPQEYGNYSELCAFTYSKCFADLDESHILVVDIGVCLLFMKYITLFCWQPSWISTWLHCVLKYIGCAVGFDCVSGSIIQVIFTLASRNIHQCTSECNIMTRNAEHITMKQYEHHI